MDTITLKSLAFHGHHGYYESERISGNQFEVDVTARGNFRPSVQLNNLDETFNYELVSDIASSVFSGKEEKLIEALCVKIGDALFERSPHVKLLSVTVRKLNPPISVPAAWAEVTMQWKR